METKEEPKTQEPRVIWVQYQEARAVKVGGVKEGCDVDDLIKHIKEQRNIKYEEADIFIDLPESVIPRLGAYLAKAGARALNPKKKLDANFFDLLGDETIEVRVRSVEAVEQPATKKARVGPEVLPRIAELSKRRSISADGINWSSYYTRRRETCGELLKVIENGGAILVRAPPLSGKTSLLQLFLERLRETLPDDALVVHTRMTSLPAAAGTDGDVVMGRIAEASEGKITVEDFRGTSKRRAVLLIDEAQIVYEHRSRFWEHLKDMSVDRPERFSVVLFSAYGDRAVPRAGTPIEFAVENTRDSFFMALRQPELVEIVTEFNRICSETPSKARISISDAVRQTIAQLTGMHAGLVYKALTQISVKFNNRSEPVTDREILSFLYGAEMFYAVQSCRAVPVLEGATESDLLRSILVSPQRLVTEFESQPYHKLVTKGVVYVRNGVLKFGSPLVEKAYMRQLIFTPSAVMVSELYDATRELFERTIKLALAGMRPSVLRGTKGVCKDSLPNERTFQMEFYRALSLLLPKGAVLSADLPAENDEQKGYVDFYVNSAIHWAIELLRQGSERREHSDRFITRAYALLERKHDLVIDMMVAKSFRGIPENTWIVIFEDTFESAMIHFAGDRAPERITICGDSAPERRRELFGASVQ